MLVFCASGGRHTSLLARRAVQTPDTIFGENCLIGTVCSCYSPPQLFAILADRNTCCSLVNRLGDYLLRLRQQNNRYGMLGTMIVCNAPIENSEFNLGLLVDVAHQRLMFNYLERACKCTADIQNAQAQHMQTLLGIDILKAREPFKSLILCTHKKTKQSFLAKLPTTSSVSEKDVKVGVVPAYYPDTIVSISCKTHLIELIKNASEMKIALMTIESQENCKRFFVESKDPNFTTILKQRNLELVCRSIPYDIPMELYGKTGERKRRRE